MLYKFLEGAALGLLFAYVLYLLFAMAVSVMDDPKALIIYGAILIAGIVGGIINVVRS